MKICHLSLSPVLTDIRVMRQVDCLREAGHVVDVVGYGAGVDERPMTAAERVRRAAMQMPAWILPIAASTRLAAAIPDLQQMWTAVRGRKFDVVQAHDAEALLVAARLARQCGAKLIYDSHEFGQGARLESLTWRLAFPAFIRAIERHCLPQADQVITVSDYLAAALQRSYGLPETPTVIRNVPSYQTIQRQPPTSGRLLLHYHGILNSGRGLEMVLEALALLPEHFHLRLTGPVRQPGYDAELQRLAARLGITPRVTFHKAVPVNQLIAHASQADIGIFVTEGKTTQELSALPNKMFEYAMAGLAVIGGPAPDILKFIADHDLGIAMPAPTPENLADELRGMTPAALHAWQTNSLLSARTNNWEAEKRKLLSIYDHVVSQDCP
ncbi:glycosyltransferase family 4 protein [Hoeflea sp. YIM 152468]|uniref:glycosyltransferase family 4 protein n=1 Tax=Hoeflea sp. YIM 152468 TaxID=3031759 RepID=UPI0023DA3227|nr:glycosyltransferase family 4 protein [Hoeflea sp. YIM 152468]MDF1610265.1 glycosyltransferase family 4 protein [Hoeflea sp. YIM 152468]